MKKILLNAIFAVLPLTIMAQLPYDTEMTMSHFQDPTVVIVSEGTVKWSSVELGKLDYTGIYLGDGKLLEAEKSHSVVVALPQVGLPDSLTFSYCGITTNGTLNVYESKDHATWQPVWTSTIATALKLYDVSTPLQSSTRYLKFEYVGKSHVLYNAVKVTEKKALSVSTDEYIFSTKKVDTADDTKSVDITWTNIVGTITSTNPDAFAVSRSTFGAKTKENETTNFIISYNHTNYGTQTGEIIIEGEGLKKVIRVSGTTERYPLTLKWNQQLGTYKTTDKVILQALTTPNQPVTYMVSDPNVAAIDGNNNLVAKCSGTVEVAAFHPGDRMYVPTDTIVKTVTFEKATPVVSVIAEDIVYGQRLKEVKLTEQFGSVSGMLEFRGIDGDSILDAGLYNLKVAFVPEDSCIYNEVVSQVQVMVNRASQTITWSQGTTTLYVGDVVALTAYSSSQLPLTYAFTNCNVYIEGNQLMGVEAGETVVVAFQTGDKNYLPSATVMQTFTMVDKPSQERRVAAEPTLDELNEDGQKYFHDGQLYIYYRGATYNAEGLRLK